MKTIVFDFDGTIANTLERIVQIYNEVAPRFRCRMVNSSDLERMRNGRPKEFMREFGISYLKLPLLLGTIRRRLKKDISELAMQPGMREILLELSKHDIKLGVLTSNSKENVEVFIRMNGLDGIFSFVYSHRSLFGKDGPLKKLKADARELVYVGDEVRDIEAAKKARVQSVGVTWGFQTESALQEASPDHLFNCASELLTLI